MSNQVWLVRWDGTGKHAKPDRQVALVLPGSRSPEDVRAIVEALYLADTGSSIELVASANGGRTIYPAEIQRLTTGRVSITCGHNPQLVAVLTSNVRLEDGDLVSDDGTG